MGLVFSGSLFGLLFVIQSRKTGARLLMYFGLGTICYSLIWLGNLLDFLSIISSGDNIDNSNGIIGVISLIWVVPLTGFWMYLYGELLYPDKNWYIIFILMVIAIIFAMFLLMDPLGSIDYIYPRSPGENLIEDNPNDSSPVGVFYYILLICFLGAGGFGTLIKGIKSEGILKKKMFLLSLGNFLIGILGVIDNLLRPGFTLIIIRISLNGSYWIIYLGLREESLEKPKIQKEIKVEGELFRISSIKREGITEEEVSLYRDQAICLVCKGKIDGFSYLCGNCKGLYCAKCVNALIKLENVCWVCERQIDKSKPVKLPEKEKEVEIEVEPQKRGDKI
jgi:heme/copper-type cytochrome/quinol oxidase subunit 4